jgi:hypothetical protein
MAQAQRAGKRSHLHYNNKPFMSISEVVYYRQEWENSQAIQPRNGIGPLKNPPNTDFVTR